MSEELILEKENDVAILRLNRPDKLNALNSAMREGISNILQEVSADKEIRVLILTGTGRGFCAGADVGGQAERLEGRGGEISPTALTGELAWKLASLKKPTIAAINGVSAGIGFSFALACDIRIAAEDARFTAAWVKRGLMPDGGATYFLPLIVGISKALYLMYTGETIYAKEAEQIGLVSKVVPGQQLLEVAKDMAKMIAKGPPIAIELSKRGAYKAAYDRLWASFEFETYGQNICRITADHKEGVRAFFEKREPEFKGR